MFDEKSKRMYRLVAWVSGITALAVVVYGIVLAVVTTGSVGAFGSTLVNVEFPLQSAKRDVEQHLRESGMNYTILQPSFFMEVWLSPALGFDAANATAQIYGEQWLGSDLFAPNHELIRSKLIGLD